jgi:hypothetical protein
VLRLQPLRELAQLAEVHTYHVWDPAYDEDSALALLDSVPARLFVGGLE